MLVDALPATECLCVCVCVCEREREREREWVSVSVYVCECASCCVCVCVYVCTNICKHIYTYIHPCTYRSDKYLTCTQMREHTSTHIRTVRGCDFVSDVFVVRIGGSAAYESG